MRIEQKTWIGNYKTLACIPVDKLERDVNNQLSTDTFAKIKYPQASFGDISVAIKEGKGEIIVYLSPQEVLIMAEQLTKSGFTIGKRNP
jgi:hypothetical protein